MNKEVLYSSRNIGILLWFLVLLDLALSAICLISPEHWGMLMHGFPYDDPAGTVRRMGAVWLAFLLLQGWALVRWRTAPHLLVLVAGVRLTEIFSDWVYWFNAEHVTLFGHFGLLVAPPSNLLFGIYLLNAYHHHIRTSA
jgi:hypothetical protein